MLRRHVCILLAVLCCPFFAAAADPAFAEDWGGGSMAFHVVHPGGSLRLALNLSRTLPEPLDARAGRHLIFWQFYDADERPVTRQAERFADPAETSREVVVADLAAAPAGIYQIRYATSGVRARLETNGASYGVHACRSRQRGVRQAWLYVPDGASEVSVSNYASAATLSDEQGELLWSSGDDPLAVTPGQVLRLDVTYHNHLGNFAVRGLPGILCPDPATARAIGGSTVETPDGRRFPHRFQARMWQWMQERNPADFAVEPARLADFEEQWLADPRNAGLLGITGPLNFVPRILAEQDLDPTSPTYGLGTVTAWLGPAYTVDEPFNPYRRHPGILHRIVLQEFAHLLRLEENGTFNANDWEGYAGVDALGFRKRAAQFGFVAPLVEPELRALWAEGVVRVMDTMGLRRVSCENQTAHWSLDHWLMAEGSGQEVYRELARYFTEGLAMPEHNPFMVTGYQQERYGPDATYQGLAAAQQAFYYRFSGDETAREGLRRIYDLFNHTVAPEPDGTMLGASNFSHRTAGSWVNRQYNGGVRLMADQLPEAGVWYRDLDLEEERAGNLDHIRRHLEPSWDDDWFQRNERWYKSYAYHPWLGYFRHYVFPTGEIQRGDWPARSAEPFFSNRNDEFVFARRPGYYAALYVGSTCHEWVRNSIRPVPHSRDWQEEDGHLVGSGRSIWQPTQGLSLVWFPDYGSWMVGMNWNVFTIQGTRADLGEGTVAWPDYYRHQVAIEAETGTVAETSRLFDQPVTVRRTTVLADDGLALEIVLEAEEAFAPERLVEQFPFLDKEGLILRWRSGETWTECPAAESTGRRAEAVSAVQFRLPSGHGVELVFAEPAAIAFGLPVRHYRQTLRRIEVDWGGSLAAEEMRRLACRLAPLAP